MTKIKIIFILFIFISTLSSSSSWRYYKKLFAIQKIIQKTIDNRIIVNKSADNKYNKKHGKYYSKQKWHKDHKLNELLVKFPKYCFYYYEEKCVFVVCLHFAMSHLDLSPNFHKIISDTENDLSTNSHVTNVLNMESELKKMNHYQFSSRIYSIHNKSKIVEYFKKSIQSASAENQINEHLLSNKNQEIVVIHATVNDFLHMIDKENKNNAEYILQKCFIFMQ